MVEENISKLENTYINDGILLVDKDESWTSNDVVMKSRHLLHTKKVGHTGTLDPFATGLLIITVNEATKAGRFIEDLKKTYIATLKLGVLTDSGDKEGNVIKTEEVSHITKEDILKLFKSFLGKQKQIPPMYSAIKINGEKLYDLARRGEIVERKARDIEIYDLKLLSFADDVITFEATVSKGTYIRVLGEDLAKALGTIGHLIALRRTKVGKYSVDEAVKIKDIDRNKIIPLSKAINFLPRIDVETLGEVEDKIKNGNKVKLDVTYPIVAFYKENKLIFIYERRDDDLYYSLRGFNNAD